MVTKEETKVEEAKTEPNLPDYELVMVFTPELTDDAFEAALNAITQFIIGKGGVIGEVQRWGKKRLAYPIKHFSEGSYVLVPFKAAPEHNKEIETNIKISEKVIRYLLVKVE